MAGSILSLAIGIICIVIGITNFCGNISSLHSYHRSRVSEEDIPAFGRMVGTGTITVGAGIVIFSGFSLASLLSGIEALVAIGSVFMIAGIVLGLIISFAAMIKYNGGIF